VLTTCVWYVLFKHVVLLLMTICCLLLSLQFHQKCLLVSYQFKVICYGTSETLHKAVIELWAELRGCAKHV